MPFFLGRIHRVEIIVIDFPFVLVLGTFVLAHICLGSKGFQTTKDGKIAINRKHVNSKQKFEWKGETC